MWCVIDTLKFVSLEILSRYLTGIMKAEKGNLKDYESLPSPAFLL